MYHSWQGAWRLRMHLQSCLASSGKPSPKVTQGARAGAHQDVGQALRGDVHAHAAQLLAVPLGRHL